MRVFALLISLGGIDPHGSATNNLGGGSRVIRGTACGSRRTKEGASRLSTGTTFVDTIVFWQSLTSLHIIVVWYGTKTK